MSQIQNSCLTLSFLPPCLFMGAALFGGKHALWYFPGASKEGLLMTASVTSIASFLHDATFNDFNHTSTRILLEKIMMIALATLCSSVVASSLNGRVKISWEAAGRFALVELLLTSVTYCAVEKSAPKKQKDSFEELAKRLDRNLEESGFKARLQELRERR